MPEFGETEFLDLADRPTAVFAASVPSRPASGSRPPRAKAKPRIAPGTWELVESLLCEEWSPEQVSGCLLGEQGLHVSHEWIYQYVYADKRQGDVSMPTCVARSGAGNATGVMTAGAKSGDGLRSTSGRRSSRNAPAPETGGATP